MNSAETLKRYNTALQYTTNYNANFISEHTIKDMNFKLPIRNSEKKQPTKKTPCVFAAVLELV